MIEIIRQLVAEKKVLILGFGREGKSSLAMLMRVGGYDSITVADQNEVQVPEGVLTLTGEHYQDSLNAYDVVWKSPGIVLKEDISYYTCRIVSQTEVFFKRFREQIIGITGTKGKSTTTTLLYHILKHAGLPAVLAGNIGIPVFDIADSIRPDTVIVLELSSHQLEYMTVSGHIGVLMNIHEEHLDHYGTMEKYVEAKRHIYTNQQEGDLLFCNKKNLPEKNRCRAKVISVSDEDLQADIQILESSIRYGEKELVIVPEQMKLVGHHNYFDIGVAYGICQEFSIPDEVFCQGLNSYEPLPHRLQFVGEVDGVRYYDDSISTICDTTIQALKSLPDTDTVLIGGMDRGIEYDDLIVYLSTCPVPHIILMASTGKRIFEEIMRDYPAFQRPERLLLVDTLEEAVACAKKITKKGKCCVLSPAAASYGIFKNFEERGEVFQKYVMGSM